MSIITFEEAAKNDSNSAVDPLFVKTYPCDTPVPANETYDGYTKVKNSTCTFCSSMCEAPDFDSSINFFNGFKPGLVWSTYGALIGLTIAWQLYIFSCRKGKIEKEYEELLKTGELRRSESPQKNINRTPESDDIFKM